MNRQAAFAERVQEVLAALALQWPDCALTVDLWRPAIVTNPTGFADDGVTGWVRLAEAVDGFLLKKKNRWYEQGVGIITQEDTFLILPSGYGLHEQDHAVIGGTSYAMIDIVEQAGVVKAKLDSDISRFSRPTRTAPVYRQCSACVRIT